jgi:hypothetical protein
MSQRRGGGKVSSVEEMQPNVKKRHTHTRTTGKKTFARKYPGDNLDESPPMRGRVFPVMVFMPAGECAGHLTCLNGKQSFNIRHFGYFNNVLVLLCSMDGRLLFGRTFWSEGERPKVEL